jgi:type II secretory pathway predicted ATPase ExeA
VFARPTADQIWLGPPQQAALSQLSRHAQVRLIVGPASTGKTTLAQHLACSRLDEAVVLQCRGANDAAGVLASLLQSADLAPWDLSEIEQRNLLTVFVQQRRSQGRRVVVLVDDAHGLGHGAVEELERLAAFKLEKRPALELLLVGPSSIAAHWRALQAAGSIGALHVCELGPASSEDLASYLEWRLERFEMGETVTPVALQMIARFSGGRYAAADVVCQMCLLLLRQMQAERVDARVVQQAMATLAARQGAKTEPDKAAPTEPPRPDVPPQGYLVVSRAGRCLTKAALGQRTLLGRSEHNDVCLPSPYLSRHHAVIVGTPEGYYLVDLNSVNGVVLNGRRVERAILCDQDVLTIGPFRLKVQIPEWHAQGRTALETESLADTAVMPASTTDTSAVWRVK